MPTMLPPSVTTGAPLMRFSASVWAASCTLVSGLNVIGLAVITSAAVTGNARSSSASMRSSNCTSSLSSRTTPSVASAPVGAVSTQARSAGSRRNRSSKPAMCSLAKKPSSMSDEPGAGLVVPPCMSRYPTSLLTQPAFRSTHPLLGTEYDNMLACIRCGLCLTSCPTYVLSLHEAEGPRGRVGMARALAEGHLAVTPSLVDHELNCLVCDACSAVCPAGVHMDPLQVVLRTALERDQKRPFMERVIRGVVFGWLFMDMRRFRAVARILWLYQRLGARWLARNSGILRVLGLAAAERLLPTISKSFVIPKGETYGPTAENADEAAFFAGCIMSTALADIDRATIRV